jgi:hypothetical protein
MKPGPGFRYDDCIIADGGSWPHGMTNGGNKLRAHCVHWRGDKQLWLIRRLRPFWGIHNGSSQSRLEGGVAKVKLTSKSSHANRQSQLRNTCQLGLARPR